jgi:hypothetical protein
VEGRAGRRGHDAGADAGEARERAQAWRGGGEVEQCAGGGAVDARVRRRRRMGAGARAAVSQGGRKKIETDTRGPRKGEEKQDARARQP